MHLIPYWDLSLKILEDRRIMARKELSRSLIQRGGISGLEEWNISTLGLRPKDLGRESWELNERGPWCDVSIDQHVAICIMGFSWIDGCIGPSAMKVYKSGTTVADVDMMRMYAPLVMSRALYDAPKDALDIVAPILLARALDGDPASRDVRVGLVMEAYFSFPIFLNPNSHLLIDVTGSYPYGLERMLVPIGLMATMKGVVISE